jgi:hypothetical protein
MMSIIDGINLFASIGYHLFYNYMHELQITSQKAKLYQMKYNYSSLINRINNFHKTVTNRSSSIDRVRVQRNI